MKRIDTSTRVLDKFGAGKDGYTDGDVVGGIPATDLSAALFDNLQEELANIVEAAGIVLDGAVLTQVRQAVRRLFGGNVTTVNAANSPLVLTADNAGIVVLDATAGNISATLPLASALAAMPFRFVRVDATANTATVNRAGADTIDGETSFAVAASYDYRSIAAAAAGTWLTTAAGIGLKAKQLQSIAASVAASALTITINPASIEFRSSALTSGTVNRRELTAAASLVVPSGATLGTTNAVKSRLVVLAIDNAGTIEAAVVNLTTGQTLDERGVISTTALSAAADSADVFYSTTARANVPYRIEGVVESTQAAAGTWATAPSLIQGAGGQAVAALTQLGVGQRWQNVTGSRAVATNYTNTTGKPIQVVINPTASASATSFVVDGVTIYGNSYGTIFAVVPPDSVYSAPTVGGGIGNWSELR